MPGLTQQVQVTFEKNKDHEYACPSAMKFFNMYKKTGAFGYASCKDMADAMMSNIDPKNDAIEKVTMSMMGGAGAKPMPAEKAMWFLNIHLKDSFII